MPGPGVFLSLWFLGRLSSDQVAQLHLRLHTHTQMYILWIILGEYINDSVKLH